MGDRIDLIITLLLVFLGVLQPVVAKLLNKKVEKARKAPEVGENVAPVKPVPVKPAPVRPAEPKPEKHALRTTMDQKSSFSVVEEEKKREPIDKRKLIIYSEILKPKFDMF